MWVCVCVCVCVCVNIPDAALIPGQPECPIFSGTQRSAITPFTISPPILVYQYIRLIVVLTNVNTPTCSRSIITTIKLLTTHLVVLNYNQFKICKLKLSHLFGINNECITCQLWPIGVRLVSKLSPRTLIDWSRQS